MDSSILNNTTNSKPINTSNINKLDLIPVKKLLTRSLEVEWLIKGYLTADVTTMLFGVPATGKSLIALDMAYCIGLGVDWHGHPVSQGTVVYIAGEGFNGLIKRFKALEIHNCNQTPDNVHISNKSIDLFNPGSVQELLDILLPFNNIKLIDTLHRNFTGDENSSKDFAVVMQHCDQLRAAVDASILLVHHSGHGTKDRSRGSSAIHGALDLEYKITKDNSIVNMQNKKAKDIEKPDDIDFELKIIKVGQSCDGDLIKAPVLSSTTQVLQIPKCSGKDTIIFNHLKDMLDNSGVPIVANDEFYTGNKILVMPYNQRKVSKDDLYKKCSSDIVIKSKKADPSKPSNNDDSKRRSFSRSIKSLYKAGFVAANDGDYLTVPESTVNDDKN